MHILLCNRAFSSSWGGRKQILMMHFFMVAEWLSITLHVLWFFTITHSVNQFYIWYFSLLFWKTSALKMTLMPYFILLLWCLIQMFYDYYKHCLYVHMDIIYKIFNINIFFSFNFDILNTVFVLLFSNGKNNFHATINMKNQCIMEKIKLLIECNIPVYLKLDFLKIHIICICFSYILRCILLSLHLLNSLIILLPDY